VYEAFYNLLRKPFSLTPDPTCFFLGRQHAEALATLQYALLTNVGVTVLSAEAGMGKTHLINRMMSNLDDGLRVGKIDNTHPDFRSILPWAVAAFELPCEITNSVAMHSALKDFLAEQSSKDVKVALVIDEAHNLSRSAFEEIRLLTNLNVSEAVGLQIVLVGQPLLSELFRNDEMKALAQRVAVDFSLAPLEYQATDDYISYCLAVSGGGAEIFDYVFRRCC